jgi:hypothetical protein
VAYYPAIRHIENAMRSMNLHLNGSVRCIALRLGATALAFLALAACRFAHAHEFCVSTATDLQNALTDASDGGMYNDGGLNSINLAQGTYKTSGSPFQYSNSAMTGALIISGGFDASCTAQTRTASLTVLDGNHATQVLVIHSANAEVDVTWLTIQNGETSQPGAGLVVNDGAGDNSSVNIADNIIQNNHTTYFSGGVDVNAGGSGHFLLLQNNLIAGNSADRGDGAGNVGADSGGATGVFNNTITQNTTSASGGRGGLYCGSSARCSVINNILWNNTTYGIYLGSTNADVEYNDYGSLGGSTPDTHQGNLSLSPKFVDANAGNFHLSADSPLLGASPLFYATTDLDGNSYPRRGKGDLGAYAETIFVDGLDGL